MSLTTLDRELPQVEVFVGSVGQPVWVTFLEKPVSFLVGGP